MAALDNQLIVTWGQTAIKSEIDGLITLSKVIDNRFAEAVKQILKCKGKVVVVGIGKSGHVGKKIAATLASTGTPSIFVHPTEASHGDLGMIGRPDILLAISKSGTTEELTNALTYCRRFGIPIIAITENDESPLGLAAQIVLTLPKAEEACPLGLAPTTSTTITLALGDAIAIACLQARDFSPSQFKDFHPGGKLGQALTRVKEVMHGRDILPLLTITGTLTDATLEMSRGRFGCVGIIDAEQKLVGIFTDGDLRRSFAADKLNRPIESLMTPSPFSVSPEDFVVDVVRLFSEKRIPSVFVTVNQEPVGIVHVHDLFQRGLV